MDDQQQNLSGEALDAAIAAKPWPKVTKAQIEARIAAVTYHRIGETVTLCNIELDNGYSVRGESACVDPRNFDETIGNSLAHKQAFDKLWPLFGFLLAEDRYAEALQAANEQEFNAHRS